MTLPSNSSMTAFPDNTLTSYTTLLAEYVTPGIPLECALQELTCPTTWYNLENECVVIIEGESGETQQSPPNLKKLQYHLNRRRNHFFNSKVDRSPVFSRLYTASYSTVAKRALRRAVTLTRTHRAAIDTTSTTTSASTPITLPSGSGASSPTQGVTPVQVEVRLLEEAVERGEITDTQAGVLLEKSEREAESVSTGGYEVTTEDAADAEPLEQDLETPEYFEVATLTNPAMNQSITDKELNAIKLELNLKKLDEVVANLQYQKVRKYSAFVLEGSYLRDNADLISYLNKLFNRKNPSLTAALKLSTKNPKATVFTYNRFTMKCTVSLPPDVTVRLPENLGLQLGFGGGIFLISKTEGDYVVDLKFKAQTVYVYSDIVKHSIVGDKRAPLLRVVAIDSAQGETQTVSFQPMIYQPVAKASFKEISMYLRDGTGSPIPFERGAVTAVLAFRPVSSIQ